MHRAARHAVCGLAAAVLAALAAGGQTPSACPNSGLRHAARLPSSVHTARRWHRLRGGQDIDDPFVAETLAAVGQWGYRTDPITAMNPFVTAERSGVVDILPWSERELLVLERELGWAFLPEFRSRLYLVDTATASDVSALPSISAGGYTPLAKSLLWEQSFGLSNFEGMTFGPPLANGSRSLLLVSDNGGGLNQDLYALSVVPEPSLAVLGSAAAAFWLFARRSAAAGKR